jgi:hypothetical protein
VKVVVGAGVAVIALFGLSVATRDDESGSTTEPPSILDTIGGALGGERALRVDEVDAPCSSGDGLAVPAGTSCLAEVEGAFAPVRVGRFRLTLGQGLEIVLRSDDTPPVTATVAGGGEVELDVLRDGGALELRCVGFGDCVVVI